jgi:polysaccharide export outer membrane protein
MTALQRLVVMTCGTLLLCGCQSVADYRAAKLPTEFRALAEPSTRQVDLSAIASHAINQNVIYPGDILEITLATGLEEDQPQTWSLRVADSGAIQVPLVGDIDVAGLSLTDAEQWIRQVSVERQIYRQPHVSVQMKRRKTIEVRVIGAVKLPGVYHLPAAGSDLLSALVAAGGMTDEAGMIIEIRHPSSTVAASSAVGPEGVALASFVSSPEAPERLVRVDLSELNRSESPPDLHMEDGTVVMVMQRESRTISVIGLVRRPDNYELPTDETLRVLDALALAGGPTVSVADKVRVIRHLPDKEDPVVIAVSIRNAKRRGKENLVLAPGDVVVVQETPTTVVVETIRGFIRFGFTSAIPGL